ncbi:MAG TPA: dipeptide/oligopeptide/nickel ABC transporter ATP-binding protein [Methanocorpusculum sp.]|nr:dipeptide/oligopeptide/nickel ABC transporter ATP-binding protein [Methanocorpusculum sp.]
MQSILNVESVSKRYRNNYLFQDVSFSVYAGETFGLFGANGEGKSTLCKCIIGLEPLDSGRVIFDGHDITNISRREFRKYQRSLQMLFQNPETSLDPRMRLIDSVTEPLSYHENKNRSEVFNELLPVIEAVGLRPDKFLNYPYQLSGGEVQRAMLVKVYSLLPKLIIADEPTSMLDMSIQAQILSLMKKLQQKNNTAYIFISHEPDVIINMCDRIGVLRSGQFDIYSSSEFRESWYDLINS